MSALQWIVKEAKSIKKKFPKRFKTWKEYVAQASAIYASKHKGKSPVGKKKVTGVKKHSKKKKVSEQSILNKIHKVKHDVERLDEAQHKHMIGIGDIKKDILDKYNKCLNYISFIEIKINGLKIILSQKGGNLIIRKAIKVHLDTYKKILKEEKLHAKELKKLL